MPEYLNQFLAEKATMLVRENFALPEDLAVKIEGFREAVSWLPPSEANPEEGNVAGTLREMPAEEYEGLAHLVVAVFQEVVERSAAGSE